MEILSDTVFRGANVTLSGGTLTINGGTSANKLTLNATPSDSEGFLYFTKGSQCYFSVKPNGLVEVEQINSTGDITTDANVLAVGNITTRANLSVSGDLNISGFANLNNGLMTPCASFNGYANFNDIVGFKNTVKVYKNTIELANSEGVSSTVSLVASYSPSKFRCGLILDDTKGCGCLEIGSISITKNNSANSLVFTNTKNFSSAYLDLDKSGVCATILTTKNYSDITCQLISKSIPITYDVPASCTLFGVELGVATSIRYDHLYSATMMKYDSDLSFGGVNMKAFKLVDVDVLVPENNYSEILIRKSSSFAMNSSDGYTLNLVYSS